MCLKCTKSHSRGECPRRTQEYRNATTMVKLAVYLIIENAQPSKKWKLEGKLSKPAKPKKFFKANKGWYTKLSLFQFVQLLHSSWSSCFSPNKWAPAIYGVKRHKIQLFSCGLTCPKCYNPNVGRFFECRVVLLSVTHLKKRRETDTGAALSVRGDYKFQEVIIASLLTSSTAVVLGKTTDNRWSLSTINATLQLSNWGMAYNSWLISS